MTEPDPAAAAANEPAGTALHAAETPEDHLGEYLNPDDGPTLLATTAAEHDDDLPGDGDDLPDPTGGA